MKIKTKAAPNNGSVAKAAFCFGTFTNSTIASGITARKVNAFSLANRASKNRMGEATRYKS
ncbi:MAG: hypothetical protein IPP17_30765 [Bacteroidetes bacterium]|nr:hypothetical protein [Bacteroidota bacterium]